MGLFKASTMVDECDKAARILKSFTDKNKIPQAIIQKAKGLAIFTGFRAGMWAAGAGGSGVVVARLPDASWSAPSAFAVRSGSFGLALGVDVFDCVCVLNTTEAVEAYTNPEIDLGGSIALAAGPVGAMTNDFKPVWTYTKSRGLYGGLTVEGTVIKEKPDVNEGFYGKRLTVAQILGGEAPKPGPEKLTEVIKSAEGKMADTKVIGAIGSEPTPDITMRLAL